MDAPFFPRLALVVGGLVRVAYGLHALLAPEAMGRRHLAPRTHGKADPRLSLRGFGGQLVVLGAFTLLAARIYAFAKPRAGCARLCPHSSFFPCLHCGYTP